MSNVSKRNAFRLALISGLFYEIATACGGTGYLRKRLTEKERNKRKVRGKIAKASRKQNRKAA